MSIGGLSAKLADFKSQKPTRQCKRCGLNYPKDETPCPHCGNMGAQELTRLKAKIDSQKSANKNLGGIFLVIALLLMFLLFLTLL